MVRAVALGLGAAVVAAVVVATRTAGARRGGASFLAFRGGAAATAGAANATLVLRNGEYGAVAPAPLYPFAYVAEPYRETTIARGDGAAAAWRVTYASSPAGEAVGVDVTTAAASHGYVVAAGATSVTVVFTMAGGAYAVDGVDVYCKYVRRELRRLSARDRAAYFFAVGEIHGLGLEEGIATYGPAFTNYEALTIKHLDKRTLLGCTPYHGADVFLTSHAAFTREFELALAAVDPTLGGSPYWDYTIDDAAYGTAWTTNSSLFSASFYGEFADDASYDEAANGFGRALPLARQGAAGFFAWPEANAYGALTEAWNTDGSPTVRRFASLCGLPTAARLPGCASLRGAVAAETTTAFRARVEYDLHAELHTAVGGATDCGFPPGSGAGLDLGAFARRHPEARPALENVALNLNLFWRGLFNDTRLNPTRAVTCPRPGDCAFGATPQAECACTCAALDAALRNASGDPDAEYEAAYAAIDSTLLFELAAGGSEGTRISDFITYEAGDPPRWRWLDGDGAPLEDGVDSALTTTVAKLVFHPATAASFTGPLAAPNDPLFWPSHSFADKVWAFARLKGLNETWDYATADDAARAIPSGCWGYARDAKLPFWDLFGEAAGAGATFESRLARLKALVGGGGGGGYTNAELHAHLNPRNTRLPFVYDHFAWPHCGVGEDSDGSLS